jgi:chemotaxis protein MotB
MFNKRFVKSATNEDENVFWVTMTDLLLGLAIIFMTLFILAMTGFTQQKLEQQSTQSEVAKELVQNMQNQKIDVQIDKLTGQVKISDLELFKLNSYELSEKGKKYLNKFMPIYINTIFSTPKLSNKISNIIIQGHTDSQAFKHVSSKEEQFMKNMDLSLKRANSVAAYIFQTDYNKKYTNDLVKTVIVEGKSFTEPVLLNGKEDYAKSRRVELKFVLKDANSKDFIGIKLPPENLN